MAHSHDLHQEILTLLHGLHRSMKKHGEDDTSDFSDLTMLQLQALFCVKHSNGITMGELADELHASAGALTALVDRLVKGGWVQRVPKQDDRRTVCLQLTTTSKEKLKHIMDERVERLHRLFSQISQKDLEELARILKLLEDSSQTLAIKEK